MAMLERVKQSSYESPPALSPALARLLAEVTLHLYAAVPTGPPRLDPEVTTTHCPLSVPSCCATTLCAVCATSITSRVTPSSVGWPSTLSCCRRTRWQWQWPRAPPSSPRLTPPPLLTLTVTLLPPRAGPGLAEPPWPGPSASLRDIPPNPSSVLDPAGLGPPVPQFHTSPCGSNKPESRGHRHGCCPDSRGTPRGVLGAGPPSSGTGVREGLGGPCRADSHGGSLTAFPPKKAARPRRASPRGGGVSSSDTPTSPPTARHSPAPNRLLGGVTRTPSSQSERRVVFKRAAAVPRGERRDRTGTRAGPGPGPRPGPCGQPRPPP